MSSLEFAPITLRSKQGATASLYPYGAHVFSWRTADGCERLFTSATAELRVGAAIRGGIPIIFPQFAGLGALPKHGLARTASWQTVKVAEDFVLLELVDNETTRRYWPHPFSAQYQVTLSDVALSVQLTISNQGEQAFSFTAALHTYLRVQDIAQVSVRGLQGLTYSDSAAGGATHVDSVDALRIDGEIDRIYFSAQQPITVHEPTRSLRCTATGFNDAVVWNPGAVKAATLADLEPEGYRRMLCIEAAAIAQPISLASGADWSGTQRLHAAD